MLIVLAVFAALAIFATRFAIFADEIFLWVAAVLAWCPVLGTLTCLFISVVFPESIINDIPIVRGF